MTIKTTFAALALILAPGLSLAEGGCAGHDAVKDAAITCAPGTTLDTATGTCVTGASS
jgi:hypothetical protein